MSIPLPLPELRELARIMNRRGGLAKGEVKDQQSVDALAKRGMVTLGALGWRATDEGARAYVVSVCEAEGKANPFAAAAGEVVKVG